MGEIQEKHAGDRSEPGEGKKVQMNRRKVGSDYEKRAGQFLERQGLVILCYNFRNRYGEIDLVAKDGETTVFVEVKYRKDGQKGLPQEAVNFRNNGGSAGWRITTGCCMIWGIFLRCGLMWWRSAERG